MRLETEHSGRPGLDSFSQGNVTSHNKSKDQKVEHKETPGQGLAAGEMGLSEALLVLFDQTWDLRKGVGVGSQSKVLKKLLGF